MGKLFNLTPLRERSAFIPVIFIGRNGDCIRTRSCAVQNKITVVDIETDLALPDLLQKSIEQARLANGFALPELTRQNNLPPGLKRALKFMHENFTKIKYAEDVCSELGISRNTFLKEFRTYFPIPFSTCLIHLKLNYAIYLAQNTSMTGKEIAHCCGYKSEYRFFQILKEKTGVTFSNIRNIEQKEEIEKIIIKLKI